MKWRRQLSIYLPALVAAAVLSWREVARPAAAVRAAQPTPSLQLPAPIRGQPPLPNAVYQLDPAGSLAEFEASGTFRTFRACTDAVEGRIAFDDHGRPSKLELSIDLRGLAASTGAHAVARADLTGDLRHLLGLSVGDRLQFTGRPVHICTDTHFGLQEICWEGRMVLAGKPHRLSMELWLMSSGPGSLRLQGVGSIDSCALPLPQRYFLGVFAERYLITVGLDLEFHPVPG